MVVSQRLINLESEYLVLNIPDKAMFLHGIEAVHGSCGQLVESDIVIFIFNSDETVEMKSTVLAML